MLTICDRDNSVFHHWAEANNVEVCLLEHLFEESPLGLVGVCLLHYLNDSLCSICSAIHIMESCHEIAV